MAMMSKREMVLTEEAYRGRIDGLIALAFWGEIREGEQATRCLIVYQIDPAAPDAALGTHLTHGDLVKPEQGDTVEKVVRAQLAPLARAYFAQGGAATMPR